MADVTSPELTAEQKAMLAEIDAMQGPEGFDVIIVCCSNLAAEKFWLTFFGVAVCPFQ